MEGESFIGYKIFSSFNCPRVRACGSAWHIVHFLYQKGKVSLIDCWTLLWQLSLFDLVHEWHPRTVFIPLLDPNQNREFCRNGHQFVLEFCWLLLPPIGRLVITNLLYICRAWIWIFWLFENWQDGCERGDHPW